ncbi:DNA exonuclease [Acinetobacter gyllenbergii]|nr:DNA exonuclease [Acinetobacter gyllenbergii]
MNMYSNRGFIFDTETHKLHGDIIEAGYIGIDVFDDGFLLKLSNYRFNKRYKPSEPIDLSAMAVHLIVDEDLVNAPPFTDFKFADGVNPEYLIGHNIDYDVDAITRAGYDTSHIKRICTLAMSRYLWPQLESHKLSVLALYLSENRSQTAHELRFAHCATQDCDTTFEVLKAICQQRQIKSIEELYKFSELARTPTHIFYGKYKGYAISDLPDQALDDLIEKSDGFLLSSLRTESFRRNELPF